MPKPQSLFPSIPLRRFPFVDHLKTLAIFLVVYGHTDAVPPSVNNWLSAFRMPLFFMLSGYLIGGKKLTLSPPRFARRQFDAIAPAYLFFASIGFLAWLLVWRHFGDSTTDHMPPIYPILATFYGTGSLEAFQVQPLVLWFLPCLLVAQVIARCCFLLPPRWALYSAILLGILAMQIPPGMAGPMEIESALVAQCFVVVGVFGRNVGLGEQSSRLTKFSVGLPLFIAGSWLATHNREVDLRVGVFQNPSLFLTAGLSISLGIIFLAQTLPRWRLSEFIGRYTIVIFALHPLVITLLSGGLIHGLHLHPEFKKNALYGLGSAIGIVIGLAILAHLTRHYVAFLYDGRGFVRRKLPCFPPGSTAQQSR